MVLPNKRKIKMTPHEIKEFYGIDITTNKRDKLFVYLRAIYTKENIETMNIIEIAENLKKDRTTVFYIPLKDGEAKYILNHIKKEKGL